jgi:hypothetical protein
MLSVMNSKEILQLLRYQVSASSFNKGWSRFGYKINGETKDAFVYAADTAYIPLLNIQLKEGRNFDSRASDSLGRNCE